MLLSIIIPTRNRQETALFAIKSATTLSGDNFEIVVQDCSNDNGLLQKIMEEFGGDGRIKYYHDSSGPSMTENWNNAFARAEGEFQIAIGDDDAVMPQILDIAMWAKNEGLDSVCSSASFNFLWPDFSPQMYDGTAMSRPFSGKFKIISDSKNIILEYATYEHPMSYWLSPNAYHTMTSKAVLDQVKKETGKIFFSTCPDVYSFIAFGKYIKKFSLLDFPFSIKGASPKSNTQRHMQGKMSMHLSEFRSRDFPEILPNINASFCMIAEAIYLGAKNTNQPDIFERIQLPFLYGHIMNENRRFIVPAVEKIFKQKNPLGLLFSSTAFFLKLKISETSGMIKYKIKIALKRFLGIEFGFVKSNYLIYTEAKTVLEAREKMIEIIKEKSISPAIH